MLKTSPVPQALGAPLHEVPKLLLTKADEPTTLLLRREDWAVVNVLTARAAMGEFYKNSILGIDRNFRFFEIAQIDDSIDLWDNTPHLPTAHTLWPVPTLAVTNYSYMHKPVGHPKPSRRNLALAYGCTCKICGKEFDLKDLTLEHIIPKSVGGKNTWGNLLLACKPCNNRKGDTRHWNNWLGQPLAADPNAHQRLLEANRHFPADKVRPEWAGIVAKARLANYAKFRV